MISSRPHLEIVIDTDFNKYDEEHLQSFTKFGDFSCLRNNYRYSFTNAFHIIDAYNVGVSVFNNSKWVDILYLAYFNPATNKLFKIDFDILIDCLKHIIVLGWNNWIVKINRNIYMI